MIFRKFARVGAVALLLLLPWIPGVPLSVVGNINLAGEYFLVALSLVILTGWVGQISLAQATFVGVGAFATGLADRAGLVFPLNLPVVVLLSALVAVLLGIVALRVRGLYLAVATLIFAWMADAYLFTATWLVGEGGSSSIGDVTVGRKDTFTYFDLSDDRVFYYLILAAGATATFAAFNLRDSKTGRAFFAVRGSETAAVSLGIDITRYKLLAFAISGALAGLAGNLTMIDLRTASPVSFQFTASLFVLSVAVVGGITSVGGAAAAAALFAALNEVFFRVPALQGWLDIVAVGLLLIVLLAYPKGLGGLSRPIAALVRRGGSASEVAARPISLKQEPLKHEERPGPSHEVALAASGLTVVFGGLVALDNVSLKVPAGQIVGLIGPNGAGKTTCFNAIAGLNSPTTGTVELFGTDVTAMPVHKRAALGIGRTFQLIQLFPQLSVFDNLLAATHVHNPTGVIAHLALTDSAARAEREARARVEESLALLDLEQVAPRLAAELPFGVLRRVEIARALVTGAPLLMLDEPASGLDSTETAELSLLLRDIRERMSLSILLIEHDVQMVTSLSDYIYVINRGKPLSEGTPAEVQRDPDVIAAYLGSQSEDVDADEVLVGGL